MILVTISILVIDKTKSVNLVGLGVQIDNNTIYLVCNNQSNTVNNARCSLIGGLVIISEISASYQTIILMVCDNTASNNGTLIYEMYMYSTNNDTRPGRISRIQIMEIG
jgi:hypothetical protein